MSSHITLALVSLRRSGCEGHQWRTESDPNPVVVEGCGADARLREVDGDGVSATVVMAVGIRIGIIGGGGCGRRTRRHQRHRLWESGWCGW